MKRHKTASCLKECIKSAFIYVFFFHQMGMGNGGKRRIKNPEVKDSGEAFNEVSGRLIKVWNGAEWRSSCQILGVWGWFSALGSRRDSGVPTEI